MNRRTVAIVAFALMGACIWAMLGLVVALMATADPTYIYLLAGPFALFCLIGFTALERELF